MPTQVIPVMGLNFGFPGRLSGAPDEIAQPRAVAALQTLYAGLACVLNADWTVSAVTGAFVATEFAGIVAAEVKTQYGFPTPDVLGVSYVAGEAAPVLERGRMTVKCVLGTPTANASVYVRTVANGARTILGSFDAQLDNTTGTTPTATNVLLPNAHWGSGVDANGIAEIVLTYAVNA
jgi:hypothetical protein